MNLGHWRYMITHTILVASNIDLKERRRMDLSPDFPFENLHNPIFYNIHIHKIHKCIYICMFMSYVYVYVYVCVYAYAYAYVCIY